MTLEKDALLSDKQEVVAQALYKKLQDAILTGFTGDKTQRNQLKDTLEFLAVNTTPTSEISNHEFSSRLKNTAIALRPIITDALLRRGQIYEMAGLIARDNTFKQLRDKHAAVPGGAEAFVGKNLNAKKAIEALNTPTFSMTFTAHPTNVVSLEAIKAQRNLLRAIDKVRYSDEKDAATAQEKLYKAMVNFVQIPAVTFDGKGESKKLSVADETEHMLHYVKNLYYDLPHVYERFDEPLRKKFKDDYHPEQLKLGLPLQSWGSSGDKDGNSKVNADTTLRAIMAHKMTMLELYTESLENIASPQLSEAKAALTEQRQKLVKLLQEFDTATQNSTPLNAASFDEFTLELRAIDESSMRKETFEMALATTYTSEQDPEQKTKLLDMVRRVRTFGMEGAKIEYRETAVEFTRIVSALIDGYATMNESERTAAITATLQDPSKLAEIHNKMQALAEKGQGKSYSKDDVTPIAYHTLKRMELAREFPAMIENQVLAECQDTSNFMEALLLQKLAAKDGKQPHLGIVPLFEEYKTLARADNIVASALSNPEYKQLIETLKTLRATDNIVQQVQLAHSDNARRAGMPAARAYIYEAHNKLRRMAEDTGITMQFYEGGSQSDAYRGGVRSISASINEFGLHNFAKLTFQGGDLLNFLNYSSSTIRLLTRNISHCADVLMQKATKKPSVGIHTENAINGGANGKTELTDATLDAQATEALKLTVNDYENNVFKNPAFNKFMEIIGYNDESAVSNTSTRAKGRAASDGQVRMEDMRTISFSETLQHAGITPTWVGARNLYTYLNAQANKDTPLTATELHSYYEKSPIFRDVIDRMCFGLAKTDIDGLRKRIPALKTSMFLDDLEQEYRYTTRLALQARTGKTISEADVALGGKNTLSHLRTLMIKEALPQLSDTLEHKNRYMDTLSDLKKLWCPELPKTTDKDSDEINRIVTQIRTLLHAAGDTVHHGRFVKADDSSYAKLFAPELKQDRSVA